MAIYRAALHNTKSRDGGLRQKRKTRRYLRFEPRTIRSQREISFTHSDLGTLFQKVIREILSNLFPVGTYICICDSERLQPTAYPDPGVLWRFCCENRELESPLRSSPETSGLSAPCNLQVEMPHSGVRVHCNEVVSYSGITNVSY